jgi:hypothetical protein
MAAGAVTIELRPPVAFILKQSGAFRLALEDLQPLWELFKPVMGQLEQELFDSQDDGAWPPLADSTLRQKAAAGYPPDPLVRTGDLMDSLVDPNRGALAEGPQEMTYGTEVEYAHWHQDGGSIPGRPPQRPIIDLKVEGRRRLEQAMVIWLNEVSRLTWGQAA